VKWDALGRALRGEIPVLIHASALNQIRAALRFVDEQKLPGWCWWAATIVARGGRAEEPQHRRDLRRHARAARRRDEPYDEAMSLPAKLQAAGVKFCISDGGGPFTAPNARNLPYHASMAAAFGLPKERR
jgi:imidazolonepropionase-like amidohydrolase